MRWLHGIAYAGGRFYLCADEQRIYDSDDGLTWHKWYGAGGPSRYYRDVAYGNGRLTAVGDAGLCSSTNGTNRSSVWLGRFPSLHAVVFANGMFVAVGSEGTVLTSIDGIVWKFRSPLPGGPSISDIIYVDGVFTVATSDGIYQSDSTMAPYLSIRSGADRTEITVTVSGEVGREYVLQSGVGCPVTNWADVVSFVLDSPETNFLETIACDGAQHLYRARTRQ